MGRNGRQGIYKDRKSQKWGQHRVDDPLRGETATFGSDQADMKLPQTYNTATVHM
jgi:hypothetical protein